MVHCMRRRRFDARQEVEGDGSTLHQEQEGQRASSRQNFVRARWQLVAHRLQLIYALTCFHLIQTLMCTVSLSHIVFDESVRNHCRFSFDYYLERWALCT